MEDKKQEIIKLWKKKKLVHPSYEEVAKQVGVTRSYVFRIIKKYLKK